jgi:hypothetical protein
MNSSPPRTQGRAPIKHMPNVTAGLNSPPLMRKKTQALTAKLKPKERAMYCSCWGFEPVCSTVRPEEEGIEFATWAPERANQRKRTVPTNSPVMAMKWLRMESGTLLRKGRRRSSWVSSALVLLAFVQGIARPLPWRGVCEVSVLVLGWRLLGLV